jgi:hypothetical protein
VGYDLFGATKVSTVPFRLFALILFMLAWCVFSVSWQPA